MPAAGTEYKETFALWALYKIPFIHRDALGASIRIVFLRFITKYQTECHLF